MARHKYGARKTYVYGMTFPSEHEAHTYIWLRSREEQGEISDLRCQVRFVLQEAFVTADKVKVQEIVYVADFVYVEDGRKVVCEAKGFSTPEWKIKKKLFLKRYPEYFLEVV